MPQKISKQLFVRNQEEVFLKINVSSIVCNALGVLQDTLDLCVKIKNVFIRF